MTGVTGAHGATVAYDPLGRLWQMTSGANVTQFLYDGDNLVAEYNGAGTLVSRYVHAGSADTDDPRIWYASGARRYLFPDHEGSIVAVSDSSGNLIAADSYDEYGIPGASNLGRFQYTGQAWLNELGLYYYKARMYSPTLGRFMQTDPVGYADQFNLYEYVGDDPLNHADPSGLYRDICIGGASDYATHIVQSYAERQAAAHPERSVQYFSGGQISGIAHAIATTPHGEPLNVIGHSLGGAEAIRQADAAGRHIDNLVTIDPVDFPGQGVSSDLSLGNVGTWTNVTANPTEDDFSDWVAALGGRVDTSVTNQADSNVSSTVHHGQFEQMMRDSHADRAIEESYRRRRHERHED